MKRLAHPEWLARLEAAIAAAESTSEGEIVVVVERASDRYREVDLGLAAAFAALVLLGLVFAPWFEVHHALVLPLLVLVHLTALALVPRIGLLRRIFTSRARRARAVREAARLAFFDEYVAASPARASVLLYASVLERAVEVVPDMGFEGKVPHATWHAIAHRTRAGRFEETLLTAVGEIGQELTKTFPARERVERKPHPPRVRA